MAGVALPDEVLGVPCWCASRRDAPFCGGRGIVGASLLVKAVAQSTFMYLIHRLREQARSHKGRFAVTQYYPIRANA